jgi:hypothetical protein
MLFAVYPRPVWVKLYLINIIDLIAIKIIEKR